MAHITIDGQIVPFEAGQTVMEAAIAAGVYIPHLCHHLTLRRTVAVDSVP